MLDGPSTKSNSKSSYYNDCIKKEREELAANKPKNAWRSTPFLTTNHALPCA
jgi:hypothetical protein